MAGQKYPLTLIPRYTTYAGAGSFMTLPMDVSPFELATVNVWAGTVVGSSTSLEMRFEESTDQVIWATCTGGGTFTPTSGQETPKSITLNRRYFRAVVTLGGTNVGVTCYMIGYLIARQR
ncbi:MAG: hypothetical protein ACT4PV_10525 [Planctomycetaceae bacterium]